MQERLLPVSMSRKRRIYTHPTEKITSPSLLFHCIRPPSDSDFIQKSMLKSASSAKPGPSYTDHIEVFGLVIIAQCKIYQYDWLKYGHMTL